jgi:hypothetical protein
VVPPGHPVMICIGAWQGRQNWESTEGNIQPDPERTEGSFFVLGKVKSWITYLWDCGMALKCGLKVRSR